MKLAVVTPLPPAATGIAEYSAELLPALAAEGRARDPEFELAVFSPQAGRAELADGLEVEALEKLEARHGRGPFHLVVYQLGNDAPNHSAALRLARRLPGVVVLHEPMIHHLVRDVALADGGLAAVKEELRYAYGEAGLMAARGWASGALAAEAWRLPLFERLVDRSRAVFVHTAAARRRVLGARPEARVHRVPHGLDLSALPAPGGAFEDARRRGRRALGVADDALLLGTFGYVTRAKRLELLLAVFGRLRRRFPGARLVIAGEVSGDYDLPSLLGGVQGVLAPGRLPREAFLRAMAATDVALNLRHPSGGESSATLLQLLALARPVVVSAGAAEDLPPGTCAPVAVDPREEEQLLATLLALAEEPELRAALGREARAWIEAECRREHAARGTLDALEAVLEAPALSSPADLGVAVSPLAPFPETDPLPALAASLGADLVDLGLGEAAGTLGEEARRVVAEVMVDLDLDRSSGSPSTAGRSG